MLDGVTVQRDFDSKDTNITLKKDSSMVGDRDQIILVVVVVVAVTAVVVFFFFSFLFLLFLSFWFKVPLPILQFESKSLRKELLELVG